MTRRDVIKSGAGIAAILAAGRAPAALVKSMLGARMTISSSGAAWKNPYVTDGLVAMWDGEWNAGPGKHDGTLRGLTNVVTGNVINLGSAGVLLGDNYVQLDTSVARLANIDTENVDVSGCQYMSIECVFDCPQVNTTGNYFSMLASCYGLSIGTYATHYLVISVSYDRKSDFKLKPSIITGAKKKITLIAQRATNPSYVVYDGDTKITGFSNGYQGSTTVSAVVAPRILQAQNASSGVSRLYTARVYSRALTAAEVAANYAIDNARFNLPDAT